MPVDDLHLRRAVGERLENAVDGAKRVVNVRRHEDAADRVDDQHVVRDHPPAARVSRCEIDRADAVLERVDVLHELALVPDVITVRDDVGARVVDLARDVRGEPRAARRVLAIDDGHVQAKFVPQLREERRDRVAARASHHITDEEDAQELQASEDASFGVFHGARLADHRHLDLTGVLHRLLDLLRA